MADIIKQAGGDADDSNNVGATHVPSTAVDYKAGSFICEIGAKDDTRIAKILFNETLTDTQLQAWANAIDDLTSANLREVKTTFVINTKRDKPALAQRHKYLALASFEIQKTNGVTKIEYLRVPYVTDSDNLEDFKTFLETNKGQLYFPYEDIESVTVLDVVRVPMRN